MLGAAAMSLSSFCVVTNALRLNLFDAGERKHRANINASDDSAAKADGSRPQTAADTWQTDCSAQGGGACAPCPDNNTSQYNNNANEREEKLMKKTMKIEGMMCPHCEAAVKGALEALDGVDAAEVSHEAGTAVVSMSADVADAALKEAVEAKDYKVLGIE